MNKDAIVILSDPGFYPSKAVELASRLASGFGKEVCFLFRAGNDHDRHAAEDKAAGWLKTSMATGFLTTGESSSSLTATIEQAEASFLIIELSPVSRYHRIQNVLNMCRQLRIPYIVMTEKTNRVSLDNVLIPVGFLPEEKEKGIFASKLARFCRTTVTILQAHDFGSRTENNTGSIRLLFDKLDLAFDLRQGRRDSFGIQKEAVERASAGDAGMVVITASREYGPDDILFGPPERRMIAAARVPLMLLNPRADLYVLCD
jgi:hypothetical protein